MDFDLVDSNVGIRNQGAVDEEVALQGIIRCEIGDVLANSFNANGVATVLDWGCLQRVAQVVAHKDCLVFQQVEPLRRCFKQAEVEALDYVHLERLLKRHPHRVASELCDVVDQVLACDCVDIRLFEHSESHRRVCRETAQVEGEQASVEITIVQAIHHPESNRSTIDVRIVSDHVRECEFEIDGWTADRIGDVLEDRRQHLHKIGHRTGIDQVEENCDFVGDLDNAANGALHSNLILSRLVRRHVIGLESELTCLVVKEHNCTDVLTGFRDCSTPDAIKVDAGELNAFVSHSAHVWLRLE